MHTVTFGLPFNGVVPLWHEDGLITWHQSDIDLAEVLGLGLVEEREITEGAPAGWSERVEVGRLMGNILELKAITPRGKRAIKDVGPVLASVTRCLTRKLWASFSTPTLSVCILPGCCCVGRATGY